MDSEKEELREAFRKKSAEVSDLLRCNPHNFYDRLEELGFVYAIDDSSADEDIAEELAARPINDGQKKLVAYFVSEDAPDDAILGLWENEIEGEQVNYPLFRRYFRDSNKQLKEMLLYGLDKKPTNIKLLSALGFFHIFYPMLKELIAHYLLACDMAEDEKLFADIASQFDSDLHPDSYDALMALYQRYPAGSRKAEWVKILLQERNDNEKPICF